MFKVWGEIKKMKKDTRDAWLIILAVIICVIILFFIIIFLVPDYNEVNDCFRETAIDYCETNNMTFFGGNRNYFTCYKNPRSFDTLEVRYIKEEREECYKLLKGWVVEK